MTTLLWVLGSYFVVSLIVGLGLNFADVRLKEQYRSKDASNKWWPLGSFGWCITVGWPALVLLFLAACVYALACKSILKEEE